MSDRGSTTANDYDHVHVTVHLTASGHDRDHFDLEAPRVDPRKVA